MYAKEKKRTQLYYYNTWHTLRRKNELIPIIYIYILYIIYIV